MANIIKVTANYKIKLYTLYFRTNVTSHFRVMKRAVQLGTQ
jgi:hypothetical protein